jgi:hypothetical protein
MTLGTSGKTLEEIGQSQKRMPRIFLVSPHCQCSNKASILAVFFG